MTVSVLWWRHEMGTFFALLPLCEEISPVTGEFPAQRPLTRSFDVFSDLHLNIRLSNRKAGDLKRYWANYDVTVMWIPYVFMPVWNDKMTGLKQQVDRSLLLSNAYQFCSSICEYFNITLCMPWIWAPLCFLCVWGCSTNEISLAHTTLAIPVVYIRGCMLGNDLT